MYSIMLNVMFENNDDYVDNVIIQDDCKQQILITKELIHQKFLLKINVNHIVNLNLNDVQYLIV
jgi:hypothetical protein